MYFKASLIVDAFPRLTRMELRSVLNKLKTRRGEGGNLAEDSHEFSMTIKVGTENSLWANMLEWTLQWNSLSWIAPL